MASTGASLAQTHPFTCNTCQVAFRSNDAQRKHYHTDWQYVALELDFISAGFMLTFFSYEVSTT